MTDYSTKDFFITPEKKAVQDFASLLATDYPVAISDWLQKGWVLFKKDAGLSIVFTVIAVIAYVAAGFFIPFGIGSMVKSVPLFAGFIIIALMLSRNQQSAFVRYFWGFRHLVPLLLFTIVSTAFIFIGLVLFVIPGLYLTVAYLFAPYLIVDKNIDFWPAMELSRKKVNRHWFGIAAFCVVLLFINALACIPLFIGLFITIPVSLYALAAAYEDIFVERTGAGLATGALINPPPV
jgi:uncharacterized membrane protein